MPVRFRFRREDKEAKARAGDYSRGLRSRSALISLCRVGHIACRFRSARDVRTPICTSDDGNSAEILGSRDESEYPRLAREGIKTLAFINHCPV
jgi:hypothetical protein